MEYKELLLTGRTQESVHLNAGYHREQSLVPFYFIFTSTICQTAFMPA